MGCGKVPDSDRYKTDSILVRSLTFPVYPHIPTLARSAPLELFLQSLAKELLCVMQQIQFFLSFAVRGQIFSSGWASLLPLFAKTDTA